MLTSPVRNYEDGSRFNVSYFDDDTIDTVRKQIGAIANIHPDRLFILAKIKLPHDYYQKDPRRWNALFHRLSYNESPLNPLPFQQYQLEYRLPQSNAVFQQYSASEWSLKPESLQDLHSPTRDFTELRIFGTDEDTSYILPLDFTGGSIVTKIPSARNPTILTNMLIRSLYDVSSIEEFVILPYSEEKAKNVRYLYYPRMSDRTEFTLGEETQALLKKNTDLIKALLDLKVQEPKRVSITRARFRAEFVSTDFGDAVSTRFEQIFYGLTVSKEIPYIGLFTSKSEMTRHKFYREDPKKNEAYLDMNMWSRWRMTLPSRNQPTLLLYRGTSKDNFDRIAITETDITITFYRDETTGPEHEAELQKEGLTWLRSMDAVMAYITKDDIDKDRWNIHEMDYVASYTRSLEQPDLRRFHCLTSIFSHPNEREARFGFLRTDREVYNISAEEMKLIQMRNENRLSVSDVVKELNVTEKIANQLVKTIEARIEEEPNILMRTIRGFPVVLFRKNDVKVTSVTEIQHSLRYANILRFILLQPDSSIVKKSLDPICPMRVEKITTQIATAQEEEPNIDLTMDEFGAFLQEFVEEETKKKAPVEEERPEEKPKTIIGEKETTSYGYFLRRLGMFDDESFRTTTKEFNYAKKCNKDNQPIILSSNDMKRLSGNKYDPQTYLSDEQIKTFTSSKGEEGLVICPEYWCVKDEIPLREDQLVEEDDGTKTCPICGRKVRTSDADDLREYSVIKRDSNIVYPGIRKLGDKQLPCCYKTPQKEKPSEKEDGAYYIVSETKADLNEFRVSFLSNALRTSLNIDETYSLISKNKRLEKGLSGYFRVGLGIPSKTLPTFLNIQTKVSSPRDSIETVLKCSFLRTWKRLGDSHLSEIESKLKTIPPYDTNEFVRENLVRILSGIDEAFQTNQLSVLENLEYTAIFLQCDVFRVLIPENKVACMFYSPMVRPRNRGIVVLQNGRFLDILSYVSRVSSRGFKYISNVFEKPFRKETFITLEKARNEACTTEVPSFSKALNIIQQVLTASGQTDFEVILDPFGRAQAFFIPGHIVLPFLPSPLPEMVQTKRIGYVSIDKDTLPTYERVLPYFKTASEYSKGYEVVEPLFNNKEERVELLLRCGLRTPIYPELVERNDPLEVIETVNEYGEDKLVFDGESSELREIYKEINYASEVFEFLLYELTNDLQEKKPELREALLDISPSRKNVEPYLRDWFERTVNFVELSTPIQFISKVREPCGQFKSKESCGGNLCGWNGKTCGIQVRNTIKKESLFHRLLSTLIDNVKIRAMVLDGRTSPFFSTILYIQLPHELIYTDNEIRQLFASSAE